MAMLSPATQSRLDQVEALSGRPVLVMRDDSLPVLATMTTARGGAAYHVIRHKPTNRPLDYIVSYQAGFLIRFFETPPEERLDFASGDGGLPVIREMLFATPGLNAADRDLAEELAPQLLHWVLMTLRSVPVGMRIDQELRRTRLELRELQAESLAAQQRQNASALSQRFGRFSTPPALLGPYAAYALFTDELLGDTTYAVPYRAAALEPDGRALLGLWGEVPADPAHDRELIDRWAGKLGMADWYRWVPYRADG